MDNALNITTPTMVVSVVIPCFRAEKTIRTVVEDIPDLIANIYCINDASDDNLAQVLDALESENPRVRVLTHGQNQGVGGAVITGYKAAVSEGSDIIVKVDSDAQMDTKLIKPLIQPIIDGNADYVKGNRFFDIESVSAMPITRLIGNAGLSFLSKLSTGYWHLFDPTNGFTAIHAEVARILPLQKLHKRYFFESDMLFRLSTLRAAVTDVPMQSIYGDEESNLQELDALIKFPVLHARNFLKRLFYNYILRDFSTASLNLIAGIALTTFGFLFGIFAWIESARLGVPATAGTVMLSALPLLVGIQMKLSFLSHDVSQSKRTPLHKSIGLLRGIVKDPDPADLISEPKPKARESL